MFGRATVSWALAHILVFYITSGYATWFTAGGAIRIAHYDVIDDVITRKLHFSIGVFYNITKNQDNLIKIVGRDSFLSPKTPKNTSFQGSPSPQRWHSPYNLGDTTRPRHITYVLV